MDNLIEEYGFVLLMCILATIFLAAIEFGLTQDGFLGKTVVNYIRSIIGG